MVGVLSFVWKRPSLTALELLWRWLAAGPMLWLAWHTLWPQVAQITPDTAALQSMTFLEPVRSATVFASQVRLFLPPVLRMAIWWVPLELVLWAVIATLGRTAVLRRADPTLVPQIGRMMAVNLVRAVCFVLLLLLWAEGLAGAVRSSITSPAQRGGEANVVLSTAEAVGLTLAAFMLWSLLIWVLDIQPLQAMARMRARGASFRELRSKLIETNLVMGIVRVALFVLAMTFSASPLPFQSQETQSYIDVWWVGVALFYVLGSDFFHVVRRVTYLRLLQSIAGETNAAPPSAS